MLLSFITDITPELKAEAESRSKSADTVINAFKLNETNSWQEKLPDNGILNSNKVPVSSEQDSPENIQPGSKQNSGEVSFEVKYKMLLERMQKERNERELKLKRYNELLFNRSDI